MTLAETNPYLTGSLTPVPDEIDVVDLPVTGQIPDVINGLFLRNGPNPAFTPRGRYHVFDGDGMLHGLWFRDGAARRYRNRWVETEWLKVDREYGQACFGGMLDFDPVAKEAKKKAGPIKNVANTHVVRHAGRILCLWEMGVPHEVTPDLDTVGPHDFDGALTTSMTAHPHEDPVTGDLLFFGYGVFPPYLTFYRADRTGRIVEKAEIDIPDPVMMHDFVVTAEHVAFLDAPAIFNLEQVMGGGDAFDWRPERGARIGVFARAQGPSSIRWFDVDPGYVFHFLNGFSDGSEVVIDGCRQEYLDMGQNAEELAARPELPVLHRWRIDLDRGVVTETQLSDQVADFPRIDERRTGLPYKIGYVTGWSSIPEGSGAGRFDMVSRYDHRTGDLESYVHGPGRTTGETIFVPDPTRTGESDGWLMSYVHDAATDRSDVVILDAAAPSAGPVGTVHLPRRAPFGFHGSWLADQT